MLFNSKFYSTFAPKLMYCMEFKCDNKHVRSILMTNDFYLSFNAYNRIRVYKKTNSNMFDDFVVVLTPSMYDNGKGIDDVLDIYRRYGANIIYKDDKIGKNHYLTCKYDLKTLENLSNKVKLYSI